METIMIIIVGLLILALVFLILGSAMEKHDIQKLCAHYREQFRPNRWIKRYDHINGSPDMFILDYEARIIGREGGTVQLDDGVNRFEKDIDDLIAYSPKLELYENKNGYLIKTFYGILI